MEQQTFGKRQASFFMKVVVIGDSGVGKTSLLQTYINGEMKNNDYKATIGSDFFMTSIQVADSSAQLQIWDTAGQERFRSIGKSLYRGTDILILVYDITNRESFDNIEHWKNDFMQLLSDDHPDPFPTLLLGNKSDLEETKRCISQEKANIYADGHDMLFAEVSALNGINVHPSFQDIALIAMNKVQVPLIYKIDNSFVLPQKFYQEQQSEFLQNKQKNQNPAESTCCLLL